jgi:hypothetical protein
MDIQSLITAGGVGAIAVMQGIILGKLSKIDKLSETVTKLDTWAFGAKGNNGANGDIAELMGERRSGLDRRQA